MSKVERTLLVIISGSLAIYVIIQRDADIARFRVRTPDDLSELSRAVLEAQDYWQMKRGDVKNL